MHIEDEFGHVSQLRRIEERGNRAGRAAFDNSHRPEHAKCCMAVIKNALFAGPVFGIILLKRVGLSSAFSTTERRVGWSVGKSSVESRTFWVIQPSNCSSVLRRSPSTRNVCSDMVSLYAGLSLREFSKRDSYLPAPAPVQADAGTTPDWHPFPQRTGQSLGFPGQAEGHAGRREYGNYERAIASRFPRISATGHRWWHRENGLALRAFTKNQCVQLQPAGKIKPLETITIATPAIFPVVARQNGGPGDSPEPAPPPR